MILLNKGHLAAALTHVADNDIRYFLNGVLFEVCADGSVHLVATDGHRLFAGLVCRLDGSNPDEQKGPFSLIIPSDTVKAAIKGAGRFKDIMLSAMPDGRYMLGDTVFIPVDGKFPDWRRVRPDFSATTNTVQTPGQFNWQYLADANKALRLWYDVKPSTFKSYRLEQRASSSLGLGDMGVMLGSDCTASVVIMGMRDDAVSFATPFVPSAYESVKTEESVSE